MGCSRAPSASRRRPASAFGASATARRRIDFPGGERPDYHDFAYFAFTVGMCFQVSDVQVSSRQIRRTVLHHALLPFAYSTAIIAFVLNLLFSLPR